VGLVNRVVARARDEEPDAIGAFAFGSYAHGTAEPSSDLDVQLVTLGEPRIPYRTWFVGERHVSVSAKSTDRLRALRSEPASWSLGFAVENPGVWLWSTAAAVHALGDPPGFAHPPDAPELEDFVEACAKALRAQESLPLRVAAHGVGATAPALVRDLSPPVRVRNRVDAVRAALALPVAPAGWTENLPVVLGLTPAGDGEVREAVERLARGVLGLLREQRVAFEQPELTRYLHDGTLERHLGV
jgi:phosphoribosyl-AMP cyclohydrolase